MTLSTLNSLLFNKKALLATALLLSLAAALIPTAQKASASSPSAGTLTPTSPVVTWAGMPATYADPVNSSEATCQDGVNCDVYTLNVSGTQADWSGKGFRVRIEWTVPAFDYALVVHKDSLNGPAVASSDNPIDSPRNWEQVDIDPAVSGVGTYVVHVIYFTTNANDPYNGSITVGSRPSSVPPQSTAAAARYFNYAAPTGMGNSAGEPSIGVNPRTGKTFFQASLDALRVTFDDTASPARATWENVSPPNAVTSLDPILFTDQRTGRTFSSQLAGATSLMSFTDDDGATWTPSQGAGIPASLDHQTVGGGPFAAPLTRDANSPLYRDAIYYCSQDVGVDASCAVSLDGGLTFGPAVRIYTQLDCDAGLHGHIKVAADGTAYVPSKGCGGQQAVIVTENNGLTWDIRKVPGSVEGETDPSLGIGADGTLYFAYSNGDGRQFVAVSHDKGRTWPAELIQDIGYYHGIQNSVFSSAVAGDSDRAAVFFLGSTTPGVAGATGPDPAGFAGTWYGYVSMTLDGGRTWKTVNATAGDPVQRGPICTKGTITCLGTTRNLLDFNDVTIDGQGRVTAAYADGCVSAQCISGQDLNSDGKLDGNDNDGTDKATIIRQSGGKSLFAAFDTQFSSTLAAAPNVVAQQDGRTAYVSWSTPDNGGSAITGYKVYRGTSAGESLLATVAGDVNSFNDATYNNGGFYYRVRAINANGDGALSTKASPTAIVVQPAQSPCKLPGVTVVTDPTGDSTDSLASHDVSSVSVAELLQADGSQKLYFTLKVGSLSPVATPNTSWKVLFKTTDGITHFVEMNTFDPTAIKYRYGHIELDATTGVNNNVNDGDADAGSTYNTDGTILLVIANSKVGNPRAGQSLTAVKGEVRVLVGATAGLLALVDDTGAGSYTVAGNDSCAPKPAAPTGLTAANSAKGVASLAWKDNSTDEQKFVIERSTSVDTGFVEVGNVGANVTTFADNSLAKKTTYYYRVRAVRGTAVSPYSNTASVTIKK